MTGSDPTHCPDSHWSVCVHAFASLQAVPSGLGGWIHSPIPLHSSIVQTLPSSGHGVPPALGGWEQNPMPSHWSVVQGSPSSVHGVPAAAGSQVCVASSHVGLHSSNAQGSPE